MLSIFSVQNLQTFLRRKNLRPPSRPLPPGRPPPGRGPEDRGPEGRAAPSDAAASDLSGAACFVLSSAITLLVGAQGAGTFTIISHGSFASMHRKPVSRNVARTARSHRPPAGRRLTPLPEELPPQSRPEPPRQWTPLPG